jgi:hypothetical protein
MKRIYEINLPMTDKGLKSGGIVVLGDRAEDKI